MPGDSPQPPPIGFYLPPDRYPGANISGIDLSYSLNEQYVPPPLPSDVGQNDSLPQINVDSFGYSWQHIGPGGPFPFAHAVRAGRDTDGSVIYVGRCFHEGEMLPAKVIGEKLVAYVSFNGEEIAKDEYEILRQGDFVWEFAANGEVPEGALQVGRTADGEVLYMARALYEGSQTPGKLHASHGVLYIPFNGEEISQSEYEVLVVK